MYRKATKPWLSFEVTICPLGVFETAVHWTQNLLIREARLAGESQGSSCFGLPRAGITSACPAHPAFLLWVLRIQFRAAKLHSKPFLDGIVSLALGLHIFQLLREGVWID